MKTLQQKKSYNGVYTLKAICAFFVVIYHVEFFYGQQLKPITNIAVPVFYIISGFFLYTGDAKSEVSKAKKWLKKIISWTLFLNVLYFLFVREMQLEISPSNLVYILFQGGFITPPLWYMTALWEALLVFIIIRSVLPEKLMRICIMIAPAAFMVSLAIGKYNCYILNNSFRSIWIEQSFITVAIPCLSLGYLISLYKEKLSKVHSWGILMLSCIILAYLENYTIGNTSTRGYFLTTLPLSVCAFMFAINFNPRSCRIATIIGKRDSANIYYFHMFVAHFFCFEAWAAYAPGAAKMYGLIIYSICILFSMTYNYLYSLSYRLYMSLKTNT